MDEVPKVRKSVLDPASDADYPRRSQACFPKQFPQSSVKSRYRFPRMDIYSRFMVADPHPSPYFVVALVVYLAHRTIVNPPPKIQNNDASHRQLYFYETCIMYSPTPSPEKNLTMALVSSTLFSPLPYVSLLSYGLMSSHSDLDI